MTNNSDLSGKVAVVTGAARGTGREIALALAAQGVKIYANDINPDKLKETVKAVQAQGGKADSFVMSVDNKMGIQSMFMMALETWGRLDILINHAQIKPKGDLLKMDEWNWVKTFDVNLKGAFLCMQTAARAMQEQGNSGCIINLTTNLPHAGYAAFHASQAGLFSLTEVAALDFAEAQIRVNAVCLAAEKQNVPPGIETPAALVAHLCSEQARDISGQTFHIPRAG